MQCGISNPGAMVCVAALGVLVLTLSVQSVVASESPSTWSSMLDVGDQRVLMHVWRECTSHTADGGVAACLADKAARAVDRATARDLPLINGIVLIRTTAVDDEATANHTQSASLDAETVRAFGGTSVGTAFMRLHQSVQAFLDSHTLTMDLDHMSVDDEEEGRSVRTGEETASMKPQDRYGTGGGGGGGGGKKRGRRLYYYVMMVLLGIYGISGPLIMKGLAMIAGKALIASKIALLLAGSIALKKMLHHDHHYSNVKVHASALNEEDHDRYYTVNTNTYPSVSPYGYYQYQKSNP